MGNDQLHLVAARATQLCGVYTHRRDAAHVFALLLGAPNVWELYRFAGLSIKQIQALLIALAQYGLIEWDKTGPRLSKPGLALAEQLQIQPIPSSIFPAGETWNVTIALDATVREQFLEIQKTRPHADNQFVQGFVTPECTLARAQLAIARGDAAGKSILVLGAEDDLIGLALALTRKPKHVTVLDLDERLVAFDNHWAGTLNLPLEAHVFDLRHPLPPKWLAQFDTFITDPPETDLAIRGFILRGVAALKEPGCAGYFGFTFHDSSLAKWWRLQQKLNQHRLVITDLLPAFNVYQNFGYLDKTPAYTGLPPQPLPDRPWFVSHWYRVVALEGFTGENPDLSQAGREFCTDAETMTDVPEPTE
ncbi:MAG: bis-aminopropyl spermidine synthase family protein [Verrucomicrobiae bacterium]|nr:bis-aminopropyl spermidine synthase family protein [Verrucomicrobiae bacterium]MCX7722501.1 bis-aminopropyl spermidine synthase family protein [Verrucomicrobiae bacterium]MDW7980645.1 bis-aminopropyl spermidine synthase family protein [Verrucomicrobiales bacterium]